MTGEMICPIMSRPKDQDSITDDDDRRLVERNGYFVTGDCPWANVFMCQREKCMAWVTTSACDGFCKLIEGGNHA